MKLTTETPRVIIEDFAREIELRKDKGPKPETEVIYFRREHEDRTTRPVMLVPNELLRFRKDNGRVSSDVLSHEKLNGPLIEKDESTQKLLAEFLSRKDHEKTKELVNSIKHTGQDKAAIITKDGFLINGNRRKLALDRLSEKTGDPAFRFMKVVILPGKDDEGGPPTLKEIEQIENRYQLQSEGKAEYYKFDRALSIKRKIDLGMSLKEQLHDDPNYVDLPEKAFEKELKKYEEEYLKPLECIDRYLDSLGREGMYNTISTGMTDPQGRWESFLEYYKNIWKKLKSPKTLARMNLTEEDAGVFEAISFKIIRQREIPGMKTSRVIRELPKMIENKDAQKELRKILKVDDLLEDEESIDSEGEFLNLKDYDKRWSAKNSETIIRQVKKAMALVDYQHERDLPINLLEDAYRKLTHDNMDASDIPMPEIHNAKRIVKDIIKVSQELDSFFYHAEKKYKKLVKKH